MIAANTIIDIVFIAIFAIIAPFSIFGAVKHSKGRRDAYVLLNLFVLLRILGDILLVVAAQDNSAPVKTITDLFTAGFIMSNIGYGFLISACISLYNSAMGIDKKNQKRGFDRAALLQNPSRLLHVINLVATILLIVGMNDSSEVFAAGALPRNSPARAHAQVDSLAQIGYILYLVVTILFILLIASHHIRANYGAHHQTSESHTAAKWTLAFVSVAQIPMLIRVAYSTSLVYSASYLNYNIYERLVLQYIMEVIAVLILLALGFTLQFKGLLPGNTSSSYDHHAYDAEKDSQIPPYQGAQQAPIAY
ncbi:hypothetical protein FA10DRAFT_302437 [Acaromyces ingoldii]|uniref:DUF7702 domain-containing protein n=1 Tax=Acaromyces ingoldii TaxID=215250 RepID=A0A316YMS9_9BASI|nr:hypothetical protein FA10DRAFT_302437 [Acaromyces ingoldii]PWN89055.1 hypothetical protein FA10DRAFT_302437 [Acaromyces ingoldii]